ncbi:MAG TPA: hypothetical protein DD435_08320, partial [Cyanobacteria bacterium UBA8530]|nr:hypothetical protein [Cyanobacteria bacterium UBA8530]
FEPFIVSGLATDTEKVGKTIGELVKAQGLSEKDKQLLFIFPDGLTANSNLLIKSIQGGLGYHVNILGGSAGNDFQMATKTFQFCNQDILNDSVAGVLITGDFDYHVEVSHGCKALGRPRTLTKTSANRLVEIDNEPALNTLRNIIDKSSMDDIAVVNLISFGESFQGKGYSSDMLIRAIFGFNDEEGTIQLAAQIPQGADVRIVRRDPDKVISATTEMTERLVASLKDPENAVYFYVNCAFRGTTLFGDDSGPDVTAIREIMGTDKDMMGFYSFGEFAPIQGENCFHNQTGVLLAME